MLCSALLYLTYRPVWLAWMEVRRSFIRSWREARPGLIFCPGWNITTLMTRQTSFSFSTISFTILRWKWLVAFQPIYQSISREAHYNIRQSRVAVWRCVTGIDNCRHNITQISPVLARCWTGAQTTSPGRVPKPTEKHSVVGRVSCVETAVQQSTILCHGTPDSHHITSHHIIT